jgi:D-arabinose 1-dehydrogenase-like Zn-dependent alcohol dehydrogenase
VISYDVVAFGAPLQRAERPTPVPQGSEVLIRTLAAGVCHSDLHIWEGGYDLGQGRRMDVADRGIRPPLTMGHEIAGEVAALGPDAAGVAVGEKSLVFPWLGCGECGICRAGEEQLCARSRSLGVFMPGGYADHVLVPHSRYLIPLGGLSPAEAAPYACSGVTTYGALKKLGALVAEQPIVLIGAGGLGLMSLTLLKAMGGKGAIVVDIDPKKREAAVRAGALAAVDGAADDAARQIRTLAGGPVMGAVDLVGAKATAQLGLDVLGKGGKLIVVGLFGGDITLPLPLIPIRALTIQGTYTGSLGELKELMALVALAKADRIPIATRPFADANAALDDLRAGRVVGRTVLTP